MNEVKSHFAYFIFMIWHIISTHFKVVYKTYLFQTYIKTQKCKITENFWMFYSSKNWSDILLSLISTELESMISGKHCFNVVLLITRDRYLVKFRWISFLISNYMNQNQFKTVIPFIWIRVQSSSLCSYVSFHVWLKLIH